MITPLRPSDPRQVEWTITRCNRFLRPIVSRITTLRKLKERNQSLAVAQSQNTSHGSPDEPQNSKRRERSSSPGAFEPKENDPDWMAGPLKKRKTARHYAARTAPTATPLARCTNSKSQLLPGELSIPTPYIPKVALAEVIAPSDKHGHAELAFAKSRHAGRPKSAEDDIVTAKFMSKTENESQLVQNLVKGFLDLMDATNRQSSDAHAPSPHGARSLFSSCLRQVPAYIANEEAYLASRQDEDDHPCDVAAEVYEFLGDTFELIPGRGWRHMREVVRAHGVSLMKSAIKDGLISREDTRTLIRHLLRPQRRQSTQPSPAEAEILMSALIATETPFKPAKCCAGRNQFYAQSLNNVASLSSQIQLDSRHNFELRGFRTLAFSTYIPIEWMATARVLPLWSNIFRMLFDHPSPDFRDAYKFLEAAVLVGTGLKPTSKHAEKVFAEVPAHFIKQHEACPKCPRPATGTFLVRPPVEQQAPSKSLAVAKTQLCTAFNNTLSSLSTILSSFAIAARINPLQCPQIDPHLPLWMLNSLSLDLLRHHKQNSATSLNTASRHAARRSVYILASTLVCHVAGSKLKAGCIGADANELVDSIKLLDTASGDTSFENLGIVDSLPEMICSIAQGSSKISKQEGLSIIQHLVRSLCEPRMAGVELTTLTRGFLRRLALSSAVEYASRYKAPEYEALIRETERSLSRTERRVVGTPARSSLKMVEEAKRGFRWEEGICEWVAATPFPSTRRTPDVVAITLSPAIAPSAPEASQPTPDSDDNDGHGADAYMSPAPSSHASDGMGEDNDCAGVATLRLSDFLAQSSPSDTSALAHMQLNMLRQRNPKRSISFDSDAIMSIKRHKNVLSSSQGSILATHKQGKPSKRTVHNRASSDVALPKSSRPVKPHRLKRTLSERYDINNSSDDELSVGSSHKEPSRERGTLPKNHASKRQPARRLLRTFSATTRPPMRLASAHVTDAEDDELSIL